MSRKDDISGKGPQFGHKRSKALNTSPKKWNVNLQTVKMNVNGKTVKIKVSTSTLKTLKKKGKI